MRAAWLSIVVVIALSGCLNGAASGAGGIDSGSLAKGWDADASPSVTVLGEPRSSHADGWPRGIHASAVAADIDEDGQPEIIVHGKDRRVRVYDMDSGRELAALPVGYPPSWHVDKVLNEPAAGRLAPDGPMSIVVASPAAVITAWTFQPEQSNSRSFEFTKAWENRPTRCHDSPGMDAPALIADIDGKPGMEVVVQTEQTGFYVLRNDGSELWGHCWAGGNAGPAAGDIDGDGSTEVVFASDSGFVSVFDGPSGAPLWTFDAGAKKYGVKPASITVAPTIADIDGKGPKEVLFTARHAPRNDPEAFEEFHMAIYAIRQNPETYQSELVWKRQPGWANPLSYTTLVVEDVDGDGRADIFGMDWNTVGHHPGDWHTFEEGNVFRLDPDGNDVWVRPMTSWWSNKRIDLADGDGDGAVEILVAAPRGEQDGIWRLDSGTGRPEGFLTAGSWELTSGPSVLRDRHGGLHVMASAGMEDQGRSAVLLYDLEVSP